MVGAHGQVTIQTFLGFTHVRVVAATGFEEHEQRIFPPTSNVRFPRADRGSNFVKCIFSGMAVADLKQQDSVQSAMWRSTARKNIHGRARLRISFCSRAVVATLMAALVVSRSWLPTFALVPQTPAEDEPPKLLGAAQPSEKAGNGDEQPAARGSIPFARVAPRKFQILFTCKICETRNSHMISRLAYQQGIVIATCPGCGSRHLLADKTGLLDVGIWDVEQLAQQGENVTRLTTDGYKQVGADLQVEDLPDMVQDEKSPLLVRNKDGLIEALPEENLGVSRAADFMADTADESSG